MQSNQPTSQKSRRNNKRTRRNKRPPPAPPKPPEIQNAPPSLKKATRPRRKPERSYPESDELLHRSFAKIKAEEMQLERLEFAKQFPGVAPVPFILNGGRINSQPYIARATRVWDTCYSRAEQIGGVKLGKEDYTLIFMCAPYTIFYGDGSPGNLPETTKIGGLGVFQLSDEDSPFNIQTCFQRVEESKTLSQAYATTGQNAVGSAFVWSSRLDFEFLSQQMGATGLVHLGTISHEALWEQKGLPNKMTAKMLITNADKVVNISQQPRFSLQSFLRSPDLIDKDIRPSSEELPQYMAGENVSYAVIHKAYTKFADGTNQNYALAYHVMANVCGFRLTEDSMRQHASRLKRLGVQHEFTAAPLTADLSTVPMPQVAHLLTTMGSQTWPHQATDNPDAIQRIASEENNGGNWLQRVGKKMKGWWHNNEHWAAPLLKHAFTFALADPVNQDTDYYVDADIFNQGLESAIRVLSNLETSGQMQTLYDNMQSLYAQTSKFEGVVKYDKIFEGWDDDESSTEFEAITDQQPQKQASKRQVK